MSKRDQHNREWEPWHLSAFVLGELDQDIATSIESAAQQDPMLREELEALRETISEVESIFEADVTAEVLEQEGQAEVSLSSQQRLATIFEHAAGVPVESETPGLSVARNDEALSIAGQAIKNWRVTAVGLFAMTACLFAAVWFSLPQAGKWQVEDPSVAGKGEDVGGVEVGVAGAVGDESIDLMVDEGAGSAVEDVGSNHDLASVEGETTKSEGELELEEELARARRKEFLEKLRGGNLAEFGVEEASESLTSPTSDKGTTATAMGTIENLNAESGLYGDVQIEFIEEIDLVIVRGPKSDVMRTAQVIEEMKEDAGYSEVEIAIKETPGPVVVLGQPNPSAFSDPSRMSNQLAGGMYGGGGMGGLGGAQGGMGGGPGGYGDGEVRFRGNTVETEASGGEGYQPEVEGEVRPEPLEPNLTQLPLESKSSQESVSGRLEREQLYPLELRLKELREKVGDEHPSVVSVRDRIKVLEKQLVELKDLERRLQIAESQVPLNNGDRFADIYENRFQKVTSAPLSTFSVDVDSASYAKSRQLLLEAKRLPPADAVRIEEFVNYFDYEYTGPTNANDPFGAELAITDCPWRPRTRLVRIALQAEKLDFVNRPKANIVFLLDVSGSMDEPNKLPLVKESIEMLVEQFGENDRVAIVVYAGAAGCVLESTLGNQQEEILAALDELNAGGSTNGGEGIQLAYDLARDHFIKDGINRVILCTDGDFNVGMTSTSELVDLVEENAKSDIFLTVLGFGMGNTNDEMLEEISNRGNGVYGFIDSRREAHRQMVRQIASNLVTVAKDVKVQVEFNPDKVLSYRLLGYENRVLAAKDFDDDSKDAGEIGAGHQVTALYEVLPTSKDVVLEASKGNPELRYRKNREARAARVVLRLDANKDSADDGDEPSGEESDPYANEWLCVKLRYKEPDGNESVRKDFPLEREPSAFRDSDHDFRWAASMVEFGMLLRDSRFVGNATWNGLLEQAESAAGLSPDPDREECLDMIRAASELSDEQRRAARASN